MARRMAFVKVTGLNHPDPTAYVIAQVFAHTSQPAFFSRVIQDTLAKREEVTNISNVQTLKEETDSSEVYLELPQAKAEYDTEFGRGWIESYELLNQESWQFYYKIIRKITDGPVVDP